ncbi:MAG: tRNA lysidine(34) synthetase TilS [Candidatus Acidiferrales bacterium]
MKSLEKRTVDSIREMRLVAPGDRVGVAVSGGGDSVALLRILQAAREKLGVMLLVVHFDHGLRGVESDADAGFVADLARTFALPFVLGRENVAAAAERNKWNLEDAARRLRYAFFERIVREGQATRIAVAHTLDDQAETLLAHLIRGTGPTGLSGIYPVSGNVVRPLLGFRREELRSYLQEHGQSWREDSTNQDVQRLRARIRARLLPTLQSEFAPRIVERLSRLAQLSREEQNFWNALVDDRFRTLVQRDENGFSIRASDLISPMNLSGSTQLDYPPGGVGLAMCALTERLIRRLYQNLRGTRQGLAARHVEQVLRLTVAPRGGRRVELPGGVIVEKSFGELRFSSVSIPRAKSGRTNERSSPGPYAYPIELPESGCATVSVPELQRRFQLKVIDWTFVERETGEAHVALDAARLQMPLILRNWRPGDAYRPRGRRRIHKLKQMFAQGRIPAGDRSAWPVLESAGRVVWARGMAPAREYCARKGTAVGIMIEEERL